MKKVMSNKWVILSLMVPNMLLFILCTLLPIVMSLVLGFTFYKAVGKPMFIGFDNYVTLFTTEPAFYMSIRNGLLMGAALVFIQHPLGILVAIFVDKIGGKAEKFFRVSIFLPCMISVVVTARMWVCFLDSNFGAFNKMLRSIGLGSLAFAWFADPKVNLYVIMFISMWAGFGWCFLLYYAGVKGIPTELYEAAQIDGAVGVKTHLYITVPMLMPIIKLNVTFAVLAGLKTMEIVFLTTDGGPQNNTQFLANYLYRKGFTSQDYGMAGALATVFVAICLGCTLLIDRFVKTETY